MIAGSATVLEVYAVLRSHLRLAHLVVLHGWLRRPGLDMCSLRHVAVMRVLVELIVLALNVQLSLVVDEVRHLAPLYRIANH